MPKITAKSQLEINSLKDLRISIQTEIYKLEEQLSYYYAQIYDVQIQIYNLENKPKCLR